MKALTREQSEAVVKILGKLSQKVKLYGKSHAPESGATVNNKLHDTLALAEAVVEADDFIIELDDTKERMQYQLTVISLLTAGPEGTRSDRPRHTLSDEERDEMEEAYETGVDPVDFAHMLAKRDVAEWERNSDNLPSDFAGFADNH